MEKTDRTKTRTNPVTHSKPYRGVGHNTNAVRITLGICMALISVALSACSSPASIPVTTSAPPATIAPQPSAIPATSTPQQTVPPTQPVNPTATSAPQQTTTTSLDPCALISSQEASSLANASFGQGKEVTTAGGMKICTYGSQTTNVFNAEVIQAPDVATAQADEAQFLADIQANLKNLTDQGLNVTQVPTFADGAVMANTSFTTGGESISGNAMGFRKGLVFFGFSDLVVGGTAPTDAAMQSEAQKLLGRLP